MAAPERVEDVGHHVIDGGRLARHERFGALEAAPELAAEHLPADELLVAAHPGVRHHPWVRVVGLGVGVRVVFRIHIDHLHHEVRVGARRGHHQVGPDRAGNRQVLRERIRLVDEHVGALRRKPLVFHHVLPRHAGGGAARKRHGLGGVAHVLVEVARRTTGRIEREPAAGVEVERAPGRLARRPFRQRVPAVAPRLEDGGLGEAVRAVPRQDGLKEGILDLLLVVLTRLAAERHVAQPAALGSRPAAVRPGPHHQGVGHAGVLPFDVLVDLQRAEQVLRVEPAAHRQHRRPDALEVRADVPRLPEGVVGLVRHQVVPELHLALEVALVHPRERTERQVEPVAVERLIVEPRPGLRRRLGPRPAEAGVEAERVGQVERAVVMPVVTDEPVGDRRLRRDGFQRGVMGDGAHRRVEPGVRDAVHPDLAVMVGHVLQQPFDRVVGVRRLVDVLRPRLRRHVRPDILELALRHQPSANVLVDEDVPVADEQVRRAEAAAVGIRAVGRHAVRRPVEENRVRSRGVLRDVNRGEQLHPVAHRHLVLLLHVVRPDVVGPLPRGGGRCKASLQAGSDRCGPLECDGQPKDRGAQPGQDLRSLHRVPPPNKSTRSL